MPDLDNTTAHCTILGLKVTGTFMPRCPDDPAVFIIEIGKTGFNAYAVRRAGVPDSYGAELSSTAQTIVCPGEKYVDLFAASSSTDTFRKVCEQILNTHNAGPRLRLTVSEDPKVDLGALEETDNRDQCQKFKGVEESLPDDSGGRGSAARG